MLASVTMRAQDESLDNTFAKRIERKMTRKIINNSGTRRKFRVK